MQKVCRHTKCAKSVKKVCKKCAGSVPAKSRTLFAHFGKPLPALFLHTLDSRFGARKVCKKSVKRVRFPVALPRCRGPPTVTCPRLASTILPHRFCLALPRRFCLASPILPCLASPILQLPHQFCLTSQILETILPCPSLPHRVCHTDADCFKNKLLRSVHAHGSDI